MKDIILAGIQGSWKGTQAKLLLEKYWDSFSYFETGNILRALMSNDNAIWEFLKDIVNSWHLVPDWIVVGLFRLFLETVWEKSVLWDGNLRRIGQTKGILQTFFEKGKKPLVVQLEIPDGEVYKRLQSRKMCKKCWAIHSTVLEGNITHCDICWAELYVREDDADLDAIKNRIGAYYEETVPALKYVEEQWLLVKIDGMKSIQEIFSEIEKLIKD